MYMEQDEPSTDTWRAMRFMYLTHWLTNLRRIMSSIPNLRKDGRNASLPDRGVVDCRKMLGMFSVEGKTFRLPKDMLNLDGLPRLKYVSQMTDPTLPTMPLFFVLAEYRSHSTYRLMILRKTTKNAPFQHRISVTALPKARRPDCINNPFLWHKASDWYITVSNLYHHHVIG